MEAEVKMALGMKIIKSMYMCDLLNSLGFSECSTYVRDVSASYDAGLTTEQKEILDKEIIMLRLQGVTI